MIDLDAIDELVHEPILPPRESTPAEGIYLRLWREYLQADPNHLHTILWDSRTAVGQREASVCASFMRFMGCNAGRCFTENALRLQERNHRHNSQRDFLMAWALENRRHRGVNGGIRTIEAMLAKSEIFVQSRLDFQPRVNGDAFSDISVSDYDTVECMVAWWAGQHAEQMRAIATPLIAEANKAHLSTRSK